MIVAADHAELLSAMKACKQGRYVVARIEEDQSSMVVDRTGTCGASGTLMYILY